MPEGSPPDVRPARQPLSRQLILDEAIASIDEHGLNGLTMRSLGARLGVEAMALYRYVNGREDLLVGVVETLVEQIRVHPGGRMEPSDGWQGFLQWLAHSVRRVAVEHPTIFPLVATRHPAAPWLRPPLRSLRIVEEFLEALTQRGFSDRPAVEAYRVFSSFLLGHLLLEVSGLGVDIGPIDEADPDQPAGGDLSEYPHLQRLQHELSQDHSATEFEQSLENLLERLALLATC